MVPNRLAPAQLDALCRLARLDVDAELQERLAAGLAAVLAAFADLSQVDTRAAREQEDSRPAGPARALRPDVQGPVLTPDAALANAPRTAGGMFVVPRTVEG